MGAVLGLDLGERRVGVAVSDPDGRVAVPLTVLDGSDEKRLIAAIQHLVHGRRVERVVLGLPRKMDGTIGEKAEWVLGFKGRLEAILPVPVDTWDERLTSVQAERAVREGQETHKGVKTRRKGRGARSRGEKGKVDQIAAVLILQGYLDRRGSSPGGEAG